MFRSQGGGGGRGRVRVRVRVQIEMFQFGTEVENKDVRCRSSMYDKRIIRYLNIVHVW